MLCRPETERIPATPHGRLDAGISAARCSAWPDTGCRGRCDGSGRRRPLHSARRRLGPARRARSRSRPRTTRATHDAAREDVDHKRDVDEPRHVATYREVRGPELICFSHGRSSTADRSDDHLHRAGPLPGTSPDDCGFSSPTNLNRHRGSVHGITSRRPSSNSELLVHAVRLRVILMNNGPRKGGQPCAMNILLKSPGLENLWQVHF
jgi:hypothetical protein